MNIELLTPNDAPGIIMLLILLGIFTVLLYYVAVYVGKRLWLYCLKVQRYSARLQHDAQTRFDANTWHRIEVLNAQIADMERDRNE
jgi:hypothetical protein